MTWLEQQVRTATLKQIGIAASALLIVVVGLAINARYLMNYFQGPYAMSRAQLLSAPSADDLDRYWITHKADRLIDAHLSEVTVHRRRGRETGRSTTGYYYVADLGNRFLLVKSPEMLTGNPDLKGALGPVKASALDTILSDQTNGAVLRARFLPMQLDLDDFEAFGNYGLIGAGIVTLAALGGGMIALMRRSNPAGHPSLRAFSGEPDALRRASDGIEADIAAGRSCRVGKVLLTSRLLVNQGGLSFDARALDDLLWAYLMVTKKKFYYVIPAGTSYAAHLHFRKGKVELSGAEPACLQALQHAATHAPWAIYGHTPEIQQAFTKDRLGFIGVVTQRHRQALEARQSQPGSQT